MLGLTSGDTAAINVGTANAHVTTSRKTEATRIVVVGVVLVAFFRSIGPEAAAQTRLEPAAPIRCAQFPQNRFSQRAADRKRRRDGLGDARGLVRVARPRGSPGTSPRS
eukprot:COSAG06_NODE_6900_length_2724_cov_5.094857_4_plen_109_part_00